MTDPTRDLLSQLSDPAQRRAAARERRMLALRNTLNGIFMLLACVAMIGMVVNWGHPERNAWCYVVALVGVCIKMGEALLRSSTLLRRPRRPHFTPREPRGE